MHISYSNIIHNTYLDTKQKTKVVLSKRQPVLKKNIWLQLARMKKTKVLPNITHFLSWYIS